MSQSKCFSVDSAMEVVVGWKAFNTAEGKAQRKLLLLVLEQKRFNNSHSSSFRESRQAFDAAVTVLYALV